MAAHNMLKDFERIRLLDALRRDKELIPTLTLKQLSERYTTEIGKTVTEQNITSLRKAASDLVTVLPKTVRTRKSTPKSDLIHRLELAETAILGLCQMFDLTFQQVMDAGQKYEEDAAVAAQ